MPLQVVVRSAIELRTDKAKGVHTQKLSTTSGMKSPPTFSTIARCFTSLATSPAAAATPAQEAEEEM